MLSDAIAGGPPALQENLPMHASLSGKDFKQQLRDGAPTLGLFLNSHSPTVAEQLAHSGYDWLLVDTQHGPMGHESLSARSGNAADAGTPPEPAGRMGVAGDHAITRTGS